MSKIAIGIPAYKAQKTIEECLSSINIQTIRNDLHIIIANDFPGDSYSYLSNKFAKLNITYLDTKVNSGPGVARNICLEEAAKSKDEWITFIDADDVFYTPYALENMLAATSQPGVIQVQSVFVSPVNTPQGKKLFPRTDLGHPWVFGRLTNVKFLSENNINFGILRQMEDGRFQHCIRLLVENSRFQIVQTNDISYVWREGSEHSITRSGADINNNIPVYNFGMCQIGAAIAFKQAIDFANEKNPFNGNITKFATEHMVGHYFTYFECVEKCPVFAEINDWVAKWFYHNCFKPYCNNVNFDILESLFMQMMSAKGPQFKKFPEKTFKQWYDLIISEEFNFDDIEQIHNKLPANIRDVEIASGLMPADGIKSLFN